MTPTVESIGRESRRVIHGTAGWTPARWRLPAADGRADRVSVVSELIQSIADLAARAEGITARTVPVPENEATLGDQLAVVTADLVAADPGPLEREAAAAAIAKARAGLFRS